MTDIEVLINNYGVIFGRMCASAIGIWAFYYFLKTLFGEGSRSPVKIGIALAVIAGAGAAFKMIPSVLQAGENSGGQAVGGGGGAYSMPSLGRLPADTDNTDHDRAAFTPAAVTTTRQAAAVFLTVGADDTGQLAAA